MQVILQKHLDFLDEIKRNNDRVWFDTNRGFYEEVHEGVKSFFESIFHTIEKSDSLERFHMHRIYRDLRFAKDKTPYKTYFRLYMGRTKPLLRGGYYLNIETGDNSRVSGGFWKPESKDLQRIRQAFASDEKSIGEILNSESIKKYFGEIQGEKLKSYPRGFNKTDANQELLLMKQFILTRRFTDKEVLNPHFFQDVIDSFLALRPFFDYMSEILTTDENGQNLFG